MKTAIIGAGNMGGSIARGLANGSLITESDIIVSNPSANKLEQLKKEFPAIKTTHNNAEAAAGADIVIVAVKPGIMKAVVRELKLKSRQILVSVAAGISFEELAHFGILPEMPMYRVIPNTAICELESMTLVSARNTNSEQDEFILSLFRDGNGYDNTRRENGCRHRLGLMRYSLCTEIYTSFDASRYRDGAFS